MKNLLIITLCFLSIFGSSFAYNPTTNDEKALNNVYLKIDKIGSKDSKKVLKLGEQIKTLKLKYTNNEKTYYLLSKLEEYINNKYINNYYELIKIIDGDTIEINYNGEIRKLRLIGINAPEIKKVSYNTNCLGKEAKGFLENKLKDIKSINIEFDESQGKTDSFGRLLGYVILDGVNLNKALINEGLAFEYTYNSKKPYKYQKDFMETNEYAKASKLGIFSEECSKNDILSGSNNKNELSTEIISNIFYTSSHYSSKLYYCENDSDWEKLSKDYLKKFNSETDLLKIYPNKKLNKPCN